MRELSVAEQRYQAVLAVVSAGDRSAMDPSDADAW
jgi:hypothetical protein